MTRTTISSPGPTETGIGRWSLQGVEVDKGYLRRGPATRSSARPRWDLDPNPHRARRGAGRGWPSPSPPCAARRARRASAIASPVGVQQRALERDRRLAPRPRRPRRRRAARRPGRARTRRAGGAGPGRVSAPSCERSAERVVGLLAADARERRLVVGCVGERGVLLADDQVDQRRRLAVGRRRGGGARERDAGRAEERGAARRCALMPPCRPGTRSRSGSRPRRASSTRRVLGAAVSSSAASVRASAERSTPTAFT